MEGWIKIHRKILDNPVVFKDSETFTIWMYLLLNATHKKTSALFNGKRIELQEGQLITGRQSISKKLNISESKVQRTLKMLEIEQQIEQQTGSKNRLVSIINWNEYQNIEQQNEQQVNNKRTTTEQQVNTNKNVKNIKNERMIRTTVGDSCVDGLQKVVDFYENNIGPIAPYVRDVLIDYLDTMSGDLIILAMQKAVEANKRTIQYIKGILNNWSKKGIRTVIEAEEENESFRNKTNKSAEEEFLNG